MAAALKYVLEARSNKQNNVYRVEICQEDYSGDITYKNIGAGHIRLMKSAGTIQKTTLFLSIQADTDFEFTDFFQYDYFKHPVYLYKNGSKIWSGYMVPESYSEEYKNPPYDVVLTATDGLAFLENYTFTSQSDSISYLYAIKHCIDNLNNNLNYLVAVDLYESNHSLTGTMFEQTNFNANIFYGEKCSDVIQKLLPFGATITQHNNYWLIRRPREDAEKTHQKFTWYSALMTYGGTVSGETVLTMGDLATGGIYPVGSAPLLEMEHAWKDAIIKKDYGKKESFLQNYNFVDGDGYWTESTVGILSIIRLNNDYYAQLSGYVNPGTDDYIEQEIEVTTTTDDFVFECNYDAIAYKYAGIISGYMRMPLEVRIQVTLGSYCLTTNGWGTGSEIITIPIESSTSSPEWKTLKIVTDTLPQTGTLTVRLYRLQHESFAENSTAVVVGSVFTNVKAYTIALLNASSVQSYQVDLVENAAEGGNTIELKPVSIPPTKNASLLYKNASYLTDDSPTYRWINNGGTAMNIEQVIADQLKTYYGAVKHRLSGCNWRGANLHLNAIAQHSKNSNRKFVVESGEWFIIEDEYSLNWVEVAAASGSVTAVEITATDNGAVHENSTAGTGSSSFAYMPNGLLFGGVVTWITGLTYAVSAASYIINNQIYESLSTQITLDTADATNDRIDVIAVDINGEVVVITGTPAANPKKPQIDPATQLELTFITVPATATEPPNVVTEIIYNENTEWTGSYSGPTVDFDDTTDPFTGSKDTAVSLIGNDDTITYTAGTAKNVADYEALSMYIQLKNTLLKSQFLAVKFLLSSVEVSNEVLLKIENTTLNEWQNVGVLMGEFNFTSDTFDALQFRWIKTGEDIDHYGFYLDLIQLQRGVNQPIPQVFHNPVTIADDSTDYLSITDTQELTLIPSGFNIHDAVTIGSGSTAYLSLNGQELDFDPDALNIPEVPTGVNKDWIEFEFRDITAGSGQSYYLDIKATVPYNIDSVVLQSDDTMDDVAVKIGSTPVTWSGSITGIDVTTSITETDAYSGYSVSAGNAVTLVTSGNDGDPTLIRGKLNITRT